jgi:hypothetical protein
MILKLTTFNLQLFGGKGSSTTYQEASVPDATPEERALLQKQVDWANLTQPVAQNLLGKATNALDNQQVVPNPNWQTMYDTAQAKTVQNQATMSQLQNGILPTAFTQNRQDTLKNDLNATVGNAISGLGQRGILNSSVTEAALNDISKNAANTLANQYSQDLSTQSQLLNQAQQMTMDPIQTAATAQEASINIPSKYLSMATGQNAPTQSLLNQMSNQRYTMASPAQTIVSQGNGGLFGGLMQGAGAYLGAACFIAGTLISTPTGSKPIEQIKIGDKVRSLNNTVEVVTFVQEPIISNDSYLTIEGEHGTKVTTTSTQPFITENGEIHTPDLVGEIVIRELDEEMIVSVKSASKELVYDLTVTGENVYFANGFAVKGRE